MGLLEARLSELVKHEHQDQLTLLESIPGRGRKTSIMLIVLTDGFKRFESSKSLCAYAGLTPIIKQSGSSVRGQSRISKMGNQELRNLLFMCSFTSSKHNPACKAIYDRITAKGKSKKLALIAVCNKLLKQAFAIANSVYVFKPITTRSPNEFIETIEKKSLGESPLISAPNWSHCNWENKNTVW